MKDTNRLNDVLDNAIPVYFVANKADVAATFKNCHVPVMFIWGAPKLDEGPSDDDVVCKDCGTNLEDDGRCSYCGSSAQVKDLHKAFHIESAFASVSVKYDTAYKQWSLNCQPVCELAKDDGDYCDHFDNHDCECLFVKCPRVCSND